MPTSSVAESKQELRSGTRYFRPELDVLRFLAFSLVFIDHVSPQKWTHWLGSGSMGVPLFFLLSAYLITELLFLEKDAYGAVSLRAFYVRRVLRIWPLYFLALFAGVLCSHLLGAPHPVNFREAAYYLLLSGNWYAGFRHYLPLGFGPLWSICVEEQFYLLWPTVVKYCGRRTVLLVCLAIWTTSQVATASAWFVGASATYMWTSTPDLMQYFAIGSALSIVLHGRTPSFRRGRAAMVIGGILMFVLFHNLSDWWSYTLAGLASTLIFVGFLGVKPGRFLGKFRYLGKISYGLYVFSLPMLMLSGYLAVSLFHIPVHHGVTVIKLALGFPMTLLLAHLSYRYFEMPFLRLKERFEIVRSRPA